jgi:4-methyl-5(b-hydroxyethyl)-thiazole monophosphate biosynthesis
MPRVLVPLADGFEEIEAITIIDVLRRAGVEVVTAATGSSQSVKGAHDIVVHADRHFDAVSDDTFDAVILPGGVAYLKLMEHAVLHDVLRRHAAASKVTAAICAAPAVLAKAGLLDGKRAACYPSVEGDVRARASALVSESVAVDGNVITSRGPATATDFALALVERLCGKAKRDEIAGGMLAA